MSRRSNRRSAPTRRSPTAARPGRPARVRAAAPASAPPGPAERTAAGLLGTVTAQASFLVAVMYFLGAVYLTAFYRYFRLDAFSLGFGFAELAMQSLNLLTASAAIVLTAAVLTARHLATGEPVLGQGRVVQAVDRGIRAAARAHLYVVGAGIALLLLWPYIRPYEWSGPALLGIGVLLGQRGRAPDAVAPPGVWSKAVPVFTAGLLVMWALSLATGQLAEDEARETAANLPRRTAVVLLSTARLSLAGPGLTVEDLGSAARYRYRYTGLRRLIERNGRYYLLPVGWNSRTGPTYVIQDGEGIRVELLPGTQRG